MSPHSPVPPPGNGLVTVSPPDQSPGDGLVTVGRSQPARSPGTGSVSPHQPTRPSWRCAGCGEDWPCQRRRDELVVECCGSVVALALAMAQHFAAAVVDHPQVSPTVLYLRFLGWLRQPRR